MNTYYKILNEIVSIFDMDQWDDQVNLFTDAINEQLNPFVHNTKHKDIYILENGSPHDFLQYNFYRERCYINGEKVKLDEFGMIKNKWRDQEIVKVIIKDLDRLEGSCNSMFFYCLSLVSVPWFNTSKVTNMSYMFYKCESLESVPLFDTSRVTNMDNMFYDCPSLSEETKQEWSSVYNFTIDDKK